MMIETKRTVRRTSLFKREYKKAKKQGKDIPHLLKLIHKLANDEPLPEKYRDHALTGDWKGYRECHINPDWLLVYSKEEESGELLLILTRLANHNVLQF
jgi:mRNA interferase YafQ